MDWKKRSLWGYFVWGFLTFQTILIFFLLIWLMFSCIAKVFSKQIKIEDDDICFHFLSNLFTLFPLVNEGFVIEDATYSFWRSYFLALALLYLLYCLIDYAFVNMRVIVINIIEVGLFCRPWACEFLHIILFLAVYSELIR